MLSREKIEAYRRMSVEERWREVEALMDDAWEFLKQLPQEEMRRRLRIARESKEASDRAMIQHFQNLQ